MFNNNLFSGDDELKIDSGADDDFDDIDDSMHTNNISKYTCTVVSSNESQPSIQTSIKFCYYKLYFFINSFVLINKCLYVFNYIVIDPTDIKEEYEESESVPNIVIKKYIPMISPNRQTTPDSSNL